AATWAALFSKARRAARPTLRLEALDDRVLPSGVFPTSIDLTSDRIASQLTTSPVLALPRSYPTIVVPSPYALPGHTLDLVGADGVTYGHVTDLSVLGTDPAGNYVVSGLFTSGTTSIVILGSITPYAGGPTNFTANFTFEGYTPSSSGYAVSFHGTISQNYQHATVSGSLAVYYPDTNFIVALQRGDKIHETAGGIVYGEPPNTRYTPVSGM